MVIQTNIAAMGAWRNLNHHTSQAAKAMERLASGLKLNRAADDPSGLAMSQRMKAQLAMIGQQEKNALDEISAAQVRDGVLDGVQAMLDRMTELSTKAASGSCSDEDRAIMDMEYQQLVQEIERTSHTTYNDKSLFQQQPDTTGGEVYRGGNLNNYLDSLDSYLNLVSSAAKNGDNETLANLGLDTTQGKTQGELLKDAVIAFTKKSTDLQADSSAPTDSDGFTLRVTDNNITLLKKVGGNSYGLAGTSLKTAGDAAKAMDAVKNAKKEVSKQRGAIGATLNRLEHTVNNLSSMQINLADSISRITDADMAKEMMNYVREKTLEQVSMFALAQANQRPQQMLSLLRSMY